LKLKNVMLTLCPNGSAFVASSVCPLSHHTDVRLEPALLVVQLHRRRERRLRLPKSVNLKFVIRHFPALHRGQNFLLGFGHQL
jgi:hypothetical protein